MIDWRSNIKVFEKTYVVDNDKRNTTNMIDVTYVWRKNTHIMKNSSIKIPEII